MRYTFTAAVVAFGMLAAVPASAETMANCEAMWMKLDTSNQGQISGTLAKPYVDAVKAAGEASSSSSTSTATGAAGSDVLSRQDFIDHCQKDAFKAVSQQ